MENSKSIIEIKIMYNKKQIMTYNIYSIENGGRYQISELKIGDRIMIDCGYHTSEQWELATIVSFDDAVDLWTNDPKIGVNVRLRSGEVIRLSDYLFEQPSI
jgi:hypothetical protein